MREIAWKGSRLRIFPKLSLKIILHALVEGKEARAATSRDKQSEEEK